MIWKCASGAARMFVSLSARALPRDDHPHSATVSVYTSGYWQFVVWDIEEKEGISTIKTMIGPLAFVRGSKAARCRSGLPFSIAAHLSCNLHVSVRVALLSP